MPGPSKRTREPTRHPLAPTPDPEEGVNPRLPETELPDEGRAEDDRGETEEERQARESEKAFDQAVTRIPPA
jgi:hypothetical protein